MRCLLLVLVLLAGCKAKGHGPEETEAALKAAMQQYLYNAINNDSSNARYHVLSVIYFEEPKKYVCEFKVNLRTKTVDTTGIMTATVSKNFQQVLRTQ